MFILKCLHRPVTLLFKCISLTRQFIVCQAQNFALVLHVAVLPLPLFVLGLKNRTRKALGLRKKERDTDAT